MGGGAASGKAGAMVASHNAAGQHLRARTTPTNPRTGFQTAVRNAVRTLSPGWNSLTDLQQGSWATYAQNVTLTNRLGDAMKISGIAHYVRSNVSRIQAGLPTIATAPGIFNLGDIPDTSLVISANSAAASITLTGLTTSDWAGQTNNSMLVYTSRPQNFGIAFFNGPYQLATVIPSSNATAGPFTFTMPFAAAATGSQIFYKVRVTRGDGRLSGAFQNESGV